MNFIYLSHTLCENTPGFAGSKGFSRETIKCINKGDSCNTEAWSLSNHIGSHVDAPLHFIENSTSVDQYSPTFWHFKTVHLIDIDVKQTGELIDSLGSLSNVPTNVELLLIRTGFEKVRSSELYWKKNPGLSANLAIDLRTRFSDLKAIGFDFLSLTSFCHREEGRVAHREFLGSKGQRPILILEDLSLASIRGEIKEVRAYPLRVKNSDGSPITMVAEVVE